MNSHHEIGQEKQVNTVSQDQELNPFFKRMNNETQSDYIYRMNQFFLNVYIEGYTLENVSNFDSQSLKSLVHIKKGDHEKIYNVLESIESNSNPGILLLWGRFVDKFIPKEFREGLEKILLIDLKNEMAVLDEAPVETEDKRRKTNNNTNDSVNLSEEEEKKVESPSIWVNSFSIMGKPSVSGLFGRQKGALFSEEDKKAPEKAKIGYFLNRERETDS